MLSSSTRAALLALATACALAATSAGPGQDHDAAAQGHHHLGTVAGGHVGAVSSDAPAVYWETPEVVCTTPPPATQPSAPAGCGRADVLVWSLDVGPDAPRLRVDWDQAYRQDVFTLVVTGPDGQRGTQASQTSYSHGVWIDDPAPGRWIVELFPERTDGTVVRMRAGVTDTARPRGDRVLLPNLRVTPPFEFGFAAPANPTNSIFLATDDVNPPMTVAGTTTNSCAADEVQEAADPTRTDEPTVLVRCLRFTVGPENAGEGHFDLRFPIVDRAQDDRDRLVEMTQVLHHTNPFKFTERPAGTYEYHATHGHYHYLDVLHYEAFEVVDETTGELRSTGVGRKSGFCPDDQGYAEWGAFTQARRGALRDHQDGSCLAVAGNGAMGMTAGWGDFYRWQRSGQYVDFTGSGDGLYVIRATVDILDNVLESDETDNSGYALIRVTGDEVEVLERGRGDSPWDPDRVLAEDNRT